MSYGTISGMTFVQTTFRKCISYIASMDDDVTGKVVGVGGYASRREAVVSLDVADKGNHHVLLR